MTNQELADDLNAALGLVGNVRVTIDVIRQWVSWGLLPKSVGRGRRVGLGRVWERDQEGHTVALRLAEFRRNGLRSKDALVAQTWIDGGHVEVGVARKAILRRFESAHRKANRLVTTNFDPRIGSDISQAKARAVVNQSGQQADVFLNSALELSDDEKLAGFSVARFGRAVSQDLAPIASRVIGDVAPDVKVPEGLFGLNGLVGILGEDDEINDSALASLQASTDAEFELARRMHGLNRRQQKLLISTPGFMALLPAEARHLVSIMASKHVQAFVGDWAVVQFAMALHSLRTDPKDISEYSELIARCGSEMDMLEAHFKTMVRSNADSEK